MKNLISYFVLILLLTTNNPVRAQVGLNAGFGTGSVIDFFEFTESVGSLIFFPFTQISNKTIDKVGPFYVELFTYDDERLKFVLHYSYSSNTRLYYRNSDDSEVRREKNVYHTAMAGSQYAYVKSENFEVYLGIYTGISLRENTAVGKPDEDFTKQYFAYQISPVGFRFGRGFGFTFELGFGFKGIVSGGVSLRL
ncbi:MAG: hypothetical protein IAE91_08260 [Ignavibacteriaceae bacterium]|nr:hypothetical protein [Ignavibacteriaceae bacterium]